jgi:hypothetical protein
MMATVSGELVVPAGALTVSAAQIRVQIRDITFSDAPAVQPVKEKVLVADVAPGAQIAFDIDVPDDALDRVAHGKMELNLEVHVDLDGSGNFSSGDLVSMQAQPIGPDSPNTALVIQLTLV